MQDKHEALRSSATQVWGPVLGRSNGMPLLAVALSPSAELVECRVNAVAINGVPWGARLALTAVLSHFPKPESEMELLGLGYNADLTKDEMEALRTRTCKASESLSSRVPPLATRSPPDYAGEEW
jgi:hypothetical protein